MPSELFTGIDLNLLYPPFLERLLAFRASLKADGLLYRTRYGFVTPARSRELHRAGAWDRPPFASAHNYGLADLSVLDPDASMVRVFEANIAETGKRAGLEIEFVNGGMLSMWPGAKGWIDSLRMRWISTDSGCAAVRLVGSPEAERARYLRKLAACWALIDAARAASPQPTDST